MACVLITGADRGIGAALAFAYRRRGDRAIAACLGDGESLVAAGIEVAPGVDVTSMSSLIALRERLAATHLDILVSNAGVFHADSFGQLDFAAMQRLYDVNALGPLRVASALTPLMGQGGKFGILTSRVGSITDNATGGMYGYRMSKAAANQLGVNLHHELKPRGIAVMLLHPGQVATDMTRELSALGEFITPEESAAGLVRQLDALNAATPPEFRHANGQLLPW
ncbi:MAG: SDR family oxidoreductase [Gammaproteobacteria bacterium]|nr:SDR family oxidoreductase [Gammaproteobacteria bacterium]